MRKYLFYILGVTLLSSCNFNISYHPHVGPERSWSMQFSKDMGLFIWEYEPDKDSLTVYGQKILLPIKESFAEPVYLRLGAYVDSIVFYNQFQVVTVFYDTITQVDRYEPVCIEGNPIYPTRYYDNTDNIYRMFPEGILPPDTIECLATIEYDYRDSAGFIFDEEGDQYVDSLGNYISHIDTVDSFLLIRKKDSISIENNDSVYFELFKETWTKDKLKKKGKV
jgi:hypothetical protein